MDSNSIPQKKPRFASGLPLLAFANGDKVHVIDFFCYSSGFLFQIDHAVIHHIVICARMKSVEFAFSGLIACPVDNGDRDNTSA